MQKNNFLPKKEFSNVVKNTPLISIDICLLKGKSILLGKRLNPPAQNSFFVPGGRILKNEKIDDAFKRIMKCEIGISLFSAKEFIGVFEHFYSDNFLGNRDFSTHYLVFSFKVKIDLKDEINTKKIESQHSDYIWYSPNDNSNNIDIHEYTVNYIKHKLIANEIN